MLDWLACRFAPRLVPLTAHPSPELPEPSAHDDLLERTREAHRALEAVPYEPHGPTNAADLLMGMGCRDLVCREADQDPDTAGRTPNYRDLPTFQPLEVPVEGGPTLTGHHSVGAPGAPLVLVVHGLFDSHVCFYVVEYAEALRRMGFHVVTLDLRDHGRLLGSEHVPGLGLVEGRDLYLAAKALARAEGVSVGLVGMSYGAHCVVRAAHEATLAGDAHLLRGGVLALCGPLDIHEAVLAFDDHSRLPRAERLRDRIILSQLMKVMVRHLRLRARGHRLPAGEEWEAYIREVLLPGHPGEPPLVGAFLGKARSAQPSVLPEIRVPTAIVHPVDDPIVPVTHARKAAELCADNPFVHVRELPCGGHVGQGAVDGPGTLAMLATWFGLLRDG